MEYMKILFSIKWFSLFNRLNLQLKNKFILHIKQQSIKTALKSYIKKFTAKQTVVKAEMETV